MPAAAPAQRSDGFAAFDATAQAEIESGRIPGAVILYGENGKVAYRETLGSREVAPERVALTPDTIFDIASLTKVVATTTAVMQLVEAGRLDLDSPVARYWPAFAQNGKAAVTVRQLLTHSSGLPADLDLVTRWDGEAEGLARAAASGLVKPPGTQFLYSDVNFIVLGELVHRISGEPLDRYAQAHIFAPLGMADTGFRPPAARLERIAATDREDGRMRQGEVQDPTAFRMGGIAGHAGLFSTADDLARFAEMLTKGGTLDGARILRPETVAQMTRGMTLPGGARRGLGWDVSSAYSAGMDRAFGPDSYGHTGYTGCLLWIDPDTSSFLIVLTSRLHPDGRGNVMPLRHAFARLIAERRGAVAIASTRN
ncbi:serine hydrolase domain-containing protein [Sphingomonas oligophenolica]|uniref:Serine hydrolase domain-containing protein n=1 Tax=Sphingomonas oligophenolica TaxID=301154 RepID=A0ABU9Y170_9SPHN